MFFFAAQIASLTPDRSFRGIEWLTNFEHTTGKRTAEIGKIVAPQCTVYQIAVLVFGQGCVDHVGPLGGAKGLDLLGDETDSTAGHVRAVVRP